MNNYTLLIAGAVKRLSTYRLISGYFVKALSIFSMKGKVICAVNTLHEYLQTLLNTPGFSYQPVLLLIFN